MTKYTLSVYVTDTPSRGVMLSVYSGQSVPFHSRKDIDELVELLLRQREAAFPLSASKDAPKKK